MRLDTNLTNTDHEAISRGLRGARLAKTALMGFPGPVPSSLKDAYQIQKMSIQAWPHTVAGWKVGGIAPKFQSQYGAKRLAGPIFDNQVIEMAKVGHTTMPAFRKGFAAVEPEFALQLGDVSKLNVDNATLEEIANVVCRCFTAIELASSPVPDINSYGPAAIVSDFGNNHGLLLGQEIQSWNAESLAKILVTTEIDGAQVGECCAPAGLEGPLGAVLFLIEQLRSTGLPTPEGLWVSTGAITGVHEAPIGSNSKVTFAGHGEINLELADFR